MSSRQINLMYAEEAVKYVETHLRGKAANKPDDVIHYLQEFEPGEFNKLLNKAKKDQDFYTGKSQKLESAIVSIGADFQDQLNAQRATTNTFNPNQVIQNGFGNCHEHSILAADYLRQKNIKSNVYYLTVGGTANEWLDHVWVVIDITPALPNGKYTITLDDVPAAFGPDAVVCDAWFGEWFVAQHDWARKMRSILNVTKVDKARKLPDSAEVRFTRKH